MRRENCTLTEKVLKLWILDADVIIDLLALDVFDTLVKHCELYLSSTVIGEVKFYKRNDVKKTINFRNKYVETGLVKEKSASAADLQEVLMALPPVYRKFMHDGEAESIAVLKITNLLIFNFHSFSGYFKHGQIP